MNTILRLILKSYLINTGFSIFMRVRNLKIFISPTEDFPYFLMVFFNNDLQSLLIN